MRFRRPAPEALAYWFKVIGVTVSLLMFMVWQHVEARLVERQLIGMRKEQDQLLYQNARMQNQINQWMAPGHLETMARKELGMVPLDAKHRIGVQLP